MLKNLALQLKAAKELHTSLIKIKPMMLYLMGVRVLEEVNTHPSVV